MDKAVDCLLEREIFVDKIVDSLKFMIGQGELNSFHTIILENI